MKYLSIDIETTGLDPCVHQILEVACVLEDTSNQVDLMDLPRLVLITPDPNDEYLVSPYTAILHQRLWTLFKNLDSKILISRVAEYEETGTGLPLVSSPDGDFTYPEYIPTILKAWLQSHNVIDWKIVPAGKNFFGFDWNFLRNSGDWSSLRMCHRALDPGPLYWKHDDEVPPDLTECLRRIGKEPTALHSALGDALDVITALRNFYN